MRLKYIEIAANDSKSYLQYNNTFHHSINKKPFNADYSDLTEKIGTNYKSPKFKVNDRLRIILKIGQEK